MSGAEIIDIRARPSEARSWGVRHLNVLLGLGMLGTQVRVFTEQDGANVRSRHEFVFPPQPVTVSENKSNNGVSPDGLQHQDVTWAYDESLVRAHLRAEYSNAADGGVTFGVIDLKEGGSELTPPVRAVLAAAGSATMEAAPQI